MRGWRWLGGGREGVWWLALAAASLLTRLRMMWRVELLPEEAYYWLYAQHPSLSYFDHPPMIAWVIRAGTWLLGNTELGVRAVGALMLVGASGFVYAAAREWTDRRSSLAAAAALHALPAYALSGAIATMDAPLVFWWSVGVYGLSVALRRGAGWAWLVAGAGLGGAMLTKYTGVFLGVGGLLAVCAHPAWRRHLRSVWPYAGALLAAGMFAPVVVWNARNGWASFAFQTSGRFVEDGKGALGFGWFALLQVAVATPLVLLALGWIVARARARGRWRRRGETTFALALCLPLLGVLAWKSFTTEIHLNWSLPAYVALLAPAAHALRADVRRRRMSGARAARGWAWTGVAGAGLVIGGSLYLALLQPSLGTPKSFGPWSSVARIVHEHEEALEEQTGVEPLVIADGKYRLASVVAFYTSGLEPGVDDEDVKSVSSQWLVEGEGLGFEYWLDPRACEGRDALYLAPIVKDDDAALRRKFRSVTAVDEPRLKALGLRLTLCRGYRGGGSGG